MRKLRILVVAIISFVTFSTSAQIKEIIKTEQTENSIYVSPTKLNFLYMGITNIIEIGICGVNNDHLTIEIDNGKIKKNSDNKWCIFVDSGIESTLKIYVNRNGEKLLYGTKKFKIKPSPSPIITLAGKRGHLVSKDEIIANPKLNAYIEDDLFEELMFTVISFELIIKNGGKSLKEFHCIGSSLPKDALEAIKNCSPDDEIVFDDVVMIMSNGEYKITRTYEPFYLYIKY